MTDLAPALAALDAFVANLMAANHTPASPSPSPIATAPSRRQLRPGRDRQQQSGDGVNPLRDRLDRQMLRG